MTDEHFNTHLDAFPGLFIPVITPGAGEGLAAFPDHGIAVRIFQAFIGHKLFGRDDVAGPGQVEAVVNNDFRLEFADEFDQFFGFPVIATLAVFAGIGEVKPDDVNFAVSGQKFRDLIPHILGITLHGAALVEFFPVRMIDIGVTAVNDKVRVMPVQKRVVEADLQAFRSESIHHFPEQIFAAGSVGNFVIGVFAVPHAEAFVMLGGEDNVLHPGVFCSLCPFAGIEEIRIEKFKVNGIIFIQDLFMKTDPFMPGGHGIQPPVDEHAEPVSDKPVSLASPPGMGIVLTGRPCPVKVTGIDRRLDFFDRLDGGLGLGFCFCFDSRHRGILLLFFGPGIYRTFSIVTV